MFHKSIKDKVIIIISRSDYVKTVAFVRATNVYDDSRATKEIITLLKAGYKVNLLAWNRNGKAPENCSKIFASYKNSINFYFYKADAENGIGLRNITKLLSWFFWVYKMLKSLTPLDSVHACNLDAGLGAYKFCKKFRTPLIYDIYDYYVDSHSIPSFIAPLVENTEIKVINYAHTTIICTEERKEQIAKASPKNILILHNSPDLDAPKHTDSVIDYVYCGALGERRLLKEILDNYKNHCELQFTFAGYGEYSNQAKDLSQKYEKFEYLGSLTYDEVLSVEAKAMVISAIYEPTIRNHRLCAPNKFYEALALGKPVIVCRNTGIDKFVEKHQIGVVINYNAEEFYDALKYLKANPDMCREIGIRARNLYEKNYRWSLMAEKLLKTYETLK